MQRRFNGKHIRATLYSKFVIKKECSKPAQLQRLSTIRKICMQQVQLLLKVKKGNGDAHDGLLGICL